MKASDAAPTIVNFCTIEHKVISSGGTEYYITACEARVSADAETCPLCRRPFAAWPRTSIGAMWAETTGGDYVQLARLDRVHLHRLDKNEWGFGPSYRHNDMFARGFTSKEDAAKALREFMRAVGTEHPRSLFARDYFAGSEIYFRQTENN